MREEDILALDSGAETDFAVGAQIGHRAYTPSSRLATIFAIEELILEDGLHEEYVVQLKAIVEADNGLDTDWLLTHATAFQRCKAFLMLYAE